MPLKDGSSIKIVHKLAFPDNITNLRIFNYDQEILEFMTNIEVFKDATIEEEDKERPL